MVWYGIVLYCVVYILLILRDTTPRTCNAFSRDEKVKFTHFFLSPRKDKASNNLQRRYANGGNQIDCFSFIHSFFIVASIHCYRTRHYPRSLASSSSMLSISISNFCQTTTRDMMIRYRNVLPADSHSDTPNRPTNQPSGQSTTHHHCTSLSSHAIP